MNAAQCFEFYAVSSSLPSRMHNRVGRWSIPLCGYVLKVDPNDGPNRSLGLRSAYHASTSLVCVGRCQTAALTVQQFTEAFPTSVLAADHDTKQHGLATPASRGQGFITCTNGERRAYHGSLEAFEAACHPHQGRLRLTIGPHT